MFSDVVGDVGRYLASVVLRSLVKLVHIDLLSIGSALIIELSPVLLELSLLVLRNLLKRR